MRRELRHFRIDGSYGWNQDWFPDWFMRMGGCAAVTACDICVYLALRRGKTGLIPFPVQDITRANYLALSRKMKPFLHPRIRGIDRLEIYQEGFRAYLRTVGETGLRVDTFPGTADFADAARAAAQQIQNGIPIPFLTLRHTAPEMDPYEWHWYLLMGYDDTRPETPRVQTVTYSAVRWVDFRRLWETGFNEKGGMILLSLQE